MITITHKHTCDICHEVHEYNIPYEFAPGSIAPFPCLPPNWRLVDGKLVCPNHNVIITDKDACVFKTGKGMEVIRHGSEPELRQQDF